MKLRVFYGYARLTKKIMKKLQLVVYFENGYSPNSEEWINRRVYVVHTRYQTENEMKDAEGMNRQYTMYGYFIDKKPFYGDIEKVLEINMLADSKNVSKEELLEISRKLRDGFYIFYGRKQITNRQLRLEFD